MKRFRIILQLALIFFILLLNACASRGPSYSHQSIPTQSDQHIALLLPLSGNYTTYGNAIKDGFFAAYYAQKKETGSAPVVTVFNTDGNNILTVYQQAVSQGANLIVGPLDKADVMLLSNAASTNIPILALNTLSADATKRANVFEFGLSPTEEAQLVAEKAWQDHRRNIIILTPQNALGDRVAHAFTEKWKSLGGNVVAQESYTNMSTLSKHVSNVLGVANSYQNEHNLRRLLRRDIRFIPARRTDFDSVFIFANPDAGRQIQPLLKFYFVTDTPVYATSAIYSGTPNPDRDRDLDGILFCDMPWILGPGQSRSDAMNTVQQQMQTLWPQKSSTFSRFYAFGVDAFYLTGMLSELQSNSFTTMHGATGVLSLTPQHVVHRQLYWARMQDGNPVVQ